MNKTDDYAKSLLNELVWNNYSSSNMSSLEHSETSQCSLRFTTEHFVLIFTFCTIFLLSVIGNSLVLLVILKQRTMRSITNIYLMNLAASDMMLSVICMPPTLVSMIMNCWVFGAYMCKVLAYLQPVVVTASAYTLAVIAFERYYAICKPLHSRIWQTRSHAYAMITLVWVIAITANGVMLFMYEQVEFSSNQYTCAPTFSPIYIFINQCYITVVLLIIPLFIMTVLYGHVIRSLKNGMKLEITSVIEPTPSNGIAAATAMVTTAIPDAKMTVWQKLSRKLSYQQNKSTSLEVNMSHRKSEASICLENPSLRSTHTQKSAMAKQRVIKMLIVVVIIFFCCWTPSYIYWLILITTDTFKSLDIHVWNDRLNTVITILNYVSSCTNPLTYCFLNKKFRNAIYSTFGVRKKNMRNHFQKVYIPVNGGTPNGKTSADKPLINRSVSSTYIQQHQVVSEEPITKYQNGTPKTRTPIISRTVHASLIHHNNRIKSSADLY